MTVSNSYSSSSPHLYFFLSSNPNPTTSTATMPDPDPDATPPSCFLRRTMATPPPSTAAGPTMTTSIYDTYLGFAALTWSRTALGLSVRADFRFPSSSSPSPLSTSSTSASSISTFHFLLRPWLLWKRRGTKRFRLKNGDHDLNQPPRNIDFAWDLTRAAFPLTGGPEPTSGFFLAAAVDGEMFLLVGDSLRQNEAYRKTKSKKSISALRTPVLVSRREFVNMPESCTRKIYTTTAKVGFPGKEIEREISIDFGGGESVDLSVGIDGRRVLEVKRLKWKFRGNERVEIDGGKKRVHVAWDVYNLLFSQSSAAIGGIGGDMELSQAVFVLRFEGEGGGEEVVVEEEEGCFRKRSGGGSGGLWSELGLFGDGDERKRRTTKKGGGKMRSLSSSSSASSGSTASSVMDWASAEENELKKSDGFSLLVYFSRR